MNYEVSKSQIPTEPFKAVYEDTFFSSVQKYINIFVFFLPISIVKIGGISITFFIFLIIGYYFLKNRKKLFRLVSLADYLIVFYFLFAILSIIYAEETYRPYPLSSDIKIVISLIYWMALSLFFKTWAHRFDFTQISKYMLFGLLITLPLYYGMGALTQNSFAYVLVITIPLSLYYIFKKYGFIGSVVFAFVLFAFALGSGSRAGAGIVFIQTVLLLFTVRIFDRKMIMGKVIIFFAVLISVTLLFNSLKYEIAGLVEPYNPDFAELLVRSEQVVQEDYSWLERKQYIVKGLNIFEEHPFLGVGMGHFKYYWVDMEIISPFLKRPLEFYNRHSAHNTYISILAGAGIFALVSLLLVQFLVIKKGFVILLSFEFDPRAFVFLSFLGMSIYFYVIAQAFGAITWFCIGYGLSILDNKKLIRGKE